MVIFSHSLISGLCCLPGLGVRLAGELRMEQRVGKEKKGEAYCKLEKRAFFSKTQARLFQFNSSFPSANLVLAAPKLIKYLV